VSAAAAGYHTGAPSRSNRVRWWMRRRLGRPAALALVLACTAAAVQALWLPTLKADHQRALQRQRLRIELPRLNEAAPDPEREALRWIDALPRTDQRGLQVRLLIEHAKAAGVTMERADYAAQADTTLPVSRLNVSVPVQGSYAAVRRYLAGVLNELPNAALESLQLERSDTRIDELRATARLMLLYRVDAP
jgi:hypothetical protein